MTTAAIHNTAVGYEALASNTSGGSNTAVGYSALAVGTSAASNTAVGYLALAADTICRDIHNCESAAKIRCSTTLPKAGEPAPRRIRNSTATSISSAIRT